MIHYIYEIEGRKVGCCKDIEYRLQLYQDDEGISPKLVILEILHHKTDQEAGDIEWQWADKLGYRRGTHYTQTLKANLIRARNGGLKGGSKGGKNSPQKNRFSTLSEDEVIEIGRMGGLLGGKKSV